MTPGADTLALQTGLPTPKALNRIFVATPIQTKRICRTLPKCCGPHFSAICNLRHYLVGISLPVRDDDENETTKGTATLLGEGGMCNFTSAGTHAEGKVVSCADQLSPKND